MAASKRVGQITINVSAGTAQLVLDLEKAKAGVNNFSNAVHGSVSSTMAASASIRALEGNFTNNIRAVEKFIAVTLKMGPLLQAAFPLVGAIAFIGLIGKMGQEVYKFVEDIKNAPEKVAGAFRGLNGPLKETNDALETTNARLENDIAKLEGKRQNTLKVALLEARDAADKLASSLDADLEKLNKVLSENKVGMFRRLLGEAGTGDLVEELGGKTGFGGFTAEIDKITDAGNKQIDQAVKLKDLKGEEAARAQLNINLLKAYSGELDKINEKIRIAQEAAKPKIATIRDATGMGVMQVTTPGDNNVDRLEQLNKVRRALEEQMRFTRDQATNTILHAKEQKLKIDKSNESDERPYQDRIKALDTQLESIKAKLANVGAPEATKVIAEAFGESLKIIQEVNKALEHHNTTLTQAEEGQIALRVQQTAATRAELDWKTKLESTTAQIKDQVQSQELLTEAIGKGYEAAKRASVETQLMRAVGGEKYNDPKWMEKNAGDVAGLRGKFGSQYDAGANERSAANIHSLQNQIELERSLAQVQMQGAEAIKLVTLAYKLRAMETSGSTPAELQKELERYNAERANANAADVAGIQQRITAVNRLAVAQISGREAVRKAELENKYDSMRTGGASDQVINLTRDEDEAKHQQEMIGKTYERVTANRELLNTLDQEEARIKAIETLGGTTLETTKALRDIENERLKIAVDQALEGGKAKDGLTAFFLEMQEKAKSAAQIVYEELNSALDKVSDQFAKLFTGQKTSFGKMITGIGEEITKSAIRSGLQQGIGAIGKRLGHKVPAALEKPDGSTEALALWVRMAQTSQMKGGFGTAGLPAAAAIGLSGEGIEGAGKAVGGAASSVVGFLGSLFKSAGTSVNSSIAWGGAKAGGGQVSADKAYLVGENGPEILTGASGRILSNSQSRVAAGGGDNHYYDIDARGTDPNLTEQRVKAGIMAAHNDAVKTGVRVHADSLRRSPRPAHA